MLSKKRIFNLKKYNKILFYLMNLISKCLVKKYKKNTIVFVVAPQNKGWILDRICKEISSRCSLLSSSIHYSKSNIPKSEVIFFSHYSLFLYALRLNPYPHHSKKVVYFTHINLDVSNKSEIVYCLSNYADLIICMNSRDEKYLIYAGVEERKLRTIVGGFDPNHFLSYPKVRVSKNILVCAAYYPRKNPNQIINIARKLPEYTFTILGKGWKNPLFLKSSANLKNLNIVECEFDEYPSVYARCSIFLSLSFIEGGPIPLLESLYMNLIPVITPTGFANDVVKHGYNGFITSDNPDDNEVIDYIKNTKNICNDISSTVEQFSWQKFSNNCLKNIYDFIGSK